MIPAEQMTDADIADELNKLVERWNQFRKDLDEEGGYGGSPGEWMWERMGELETEQKRRKVKLTPVQLFTLRAIQKKRELDACRIYPTTEKALLRKQLIVAAPRLYFGPRSLRYRLTPLGRHVLATHIEK